MTWVHVAIIGGLLAVLAQALLNLRAMPRLRAPASRAHRGAGPRVSVLIPARNEGARIARCLDAWRAALDPATELLVLDDESTDDTRSHAQAALAGMRQARLIPGAPLPPGWTGKSFACHQLARAASGEILVFADADIEPRPGVLAGLLEALERPRTAAVTVLPRHTATSRLGRHLAPLQAWAVTSFCPLWLGPRRSPRLAVANGQLLAVRRAAYEAAGGHRAVRESLAEDAELGRRLAAAGYDVALLDGSALVRGASYETVRDTWRGNVKNLFPLLFASRPLAWAASAALLLAWVVPWITLVTALADAGRGLPLGLIEVALGLASRLLVARRFGHPLADSWSHPFLVLLLAAMIAASASMYRRGRVSWRGRAYPVGAAAAATSPTLHLPEQTSP
jgi:chlorobactene glucosyltransferase